jgi:hypothetical protein
MCVGFGFNRLCCWILDLRALPFTIWLTLYYPVDFMFYITHAGIHGQGMLANSIVAKTYLLNHLLHHRPRQTWFTYFSNALIEPQVKNAVDIMLVLYVYELGSTGVYSVVLQVRNQRRLVWENSLTKRCRISFLNTSFTWQLT